MATATPSIISRVFSKVWGGGGGSGDGGEGDTRNHPIYLKSKKWYRYAYRPWERDSCHFFLV